MHIVGIIQARMGSTRLPGKVLMEVLGKPLLQHQIERVQRAATLDKVIVATSTLPQDDVIAALCEKINIPCFRGDEQDVLSRYYLCAKQYQADVVVRLTADCPLSDPEIIDAVVQKALVSKLDYCANTIPFETTVFPDGTDVEVFTMSALGRAFNEASNLPDREHVTHYLWKEGHGFTTGQYKIDQDYSGYRITVDYPEDFEVVKFIFEELQELNLKGNLQGIIRVLQNNPGIVALNKQYHFK